MTGLLGAVVGGGVGAAAVALVASGRGRPVGGTVGRALADADASAAFSPVSRRWWSPPCCSGPTRGLGRSGECWIWSRCSASAPRCSPPIAAPAIWRGGSDPLVVALPVLAAITGGLVAARLWAPVARLAARALPTNSVAGRIGLLGLIRRPLRPSATVAFLTAAVASVVFAGAYRATLLASDADQAAFRVPLDATLTSAADGPAPSAVLETGPHPAGTSAWPVLRVPGAVTRLAGVVDAVPVLGVDGGALRLVHRWARITGSSLSAASVAAKLRAGVAPVGPRLPPGTRRLTITATGLDERTDVSMWVGTASGRVVLVSLQRHAGRLIGSVPYLRRTALRIVAFGIDENSDYASREAHTVGEGTTDQPTVTGVLSLRSITADGRPVSPDWSTWGSARGSTTANGTTLVLRYRISGAPMIAIPGYAATGTTLPVAVDPSTAAAAHGGVLQLVLDGDAPVSAQVVAVLPRMPTVGGPFILADRGALTRVLNRAQPGRSPVEYWVSGTVPWRGLTVTSRAAVQADLDSDPIGRGARTLLIVVALLALAVAAVSLVLLVIGERRDGAGELYAWEADGTRPGTLRRMLVVRMLAVAAVAVPVGAATGLVLAHVGTKLVAVDASGSTPSPPLSVTLGSVWTPLALLGGVGAGVLLGWTVAARSLRERYPSGADADLR